MYVYLFFPVTMSSVYVYIQLQYLEDYAERLELNIWYNTEIKEVTRPPPSEGYEESVPFYLEDQNEIIHLCDVLIVRYGNQSHNSLPIAIPYPLNPSVRGYKGSTIVQVLNVEVKSYDCTQLWCIIRIWPMVYTYLCPIQTTD